MSKIPANKPPSKLSPTAGIYDMHGPIPVADAVESDTESAWALFEESRMLQDETPTKRDDLPPHFEDTNVMVRPDFEPTDFEATKAAPLKP
jgi:hypothetical protein